MSGIHVTCVSNQQQTHPTLEWYHPAAPAKQRASHKCVACRTVSPAMKAPISNDNPMRPVTSDMDKHRLT